MAFFKNYSVEPFYLFFCFFILSYNSGPTHSLAYAHHSMHEFISLKMLSPHLLHCTLTSDEKISTSSPQRGHFLIVRVGVRKRAVPGQLLNNAIPFPGGYIWGLCSPIFRWHRRKLRC